MEVLGELAQLSSQEGQRWATIKVARSRVIIDHFGQIKLLFEAGCLEHGVKLVLGQGQDVDDIV